jgi:hypothetical protein
LDDVYEFNDAVAVLSDAVAVLSDAVVKFNDAVVCHILPNIVLLDDVYEFNEELNIFNAVISVVDDDTNPKLVICCDELINVTDFNDDVYDSIPFISSLIEDVKLFTELVNALNNVISPEVPEVPSIPLVPDVPLLPPVPLTPLVPLIPDVPDVPAPPLVPAVTKDEVAIRVVIFPLPPTQIYPSAKDEVNAPLTNKPLASNVAESVLTF